MYLVGETTETTFDNSEKYITNTDSWTSETQMPTARHGLIAAAINDKIYVIGDELEPDWTVSGANEIFQVDQGGN